MSGVWGSVESEHLCIYLFAISLILLIIGIGYLIIFGTTLADFLVIVAGLILNSIAFYYCGSHIRGW